MICYNFFTKNNTTSHEKLDFVRVMLRKANARAQRAPPANAQAAWQMVAPVCQRVDAGRAR